MICGGVAAVRSAARCLLALPCPTLAGTCHFACLVTGPAAAVGAWLSALRWRAFWRAGVGEADAGRGRASAPGACTPRCAPQDPSPAARGAPGAGSQPRPRRRWSAGSRALAQAGASSPPRVGIHSGGCHAVSASPLRRPSVGVERLPRRVRRAPPAPPAPLGGRRAVPGSVPRLCPGFGTSQDPPPPPSAHRAPGEALLPADLRGGRVLGARRADARIRARHSRGRDVAPYRRHRRRGDQTCGLDWVFGDGLVKSSSSITHPTKDLGRGGGRSDEGPGICLEASPHHICLLDRRSEIPPTWRERFCPEHMWMMFRRWLAESASGQQICQA